MRHPNDSKADLRFLIPKDASKAADIDITLVYCNQRTTCEDSADRIWAWAATQGIPTSCIAFYHAKIGEKRKRELEEKLQTGEIRILVCTDAVGMVRHVTIKTMSKVRTEINNQHRDVICVTYSVLCCGNCHHHSVLSFNELAVPVGTSICLLRPF